MAIPWIEYAEEIDPAIAEAARRTCLNVRRRQESLLAGFERGALLWLAERTPAAVNSDHLTILGFAAQILTGIAYACSRWNRYTLLGAIAAIGLNWLGDSLDGTLARYRNRQRPRYGFYVDHMVDSFGAVALLGGLALSGYMHPSIAVGLLVAFLLLSVQTYLATHAVGEFRLSYWHFGPTELRILLVIGNIALFFRPMVHVLGDVYKLFDVGGIIGLAGMTTMLLVWTAQNTARLYREETNR